MAGNASRELIDGLNEQLNREITTFLRYMLQAATISGMEHEPVRDMYLAEASNEVGHAQYLANQIVLLGGTPKLDPDLAPPLGSVREMLEADAEEEVADVNNYAKLASRAEREGLFALKIKMEEQAADEDEHGYEMRRLLG